MKSKFALIAFFLQAGLLHPTNSVWTNAAGGNWNLAGNWSMGIPLVIGDEAQFNSPTIMSPTNLTITLSAAPPASIVVSAIVFDSSANYTIAAGNEPLFFQTASGPAIIQVTNNSGNGVQTISAGFTMTSPLEVSVLSTANFTLSGIIGGAQSLTMVSPGTGNLVLSGINTYSGGTIIDSGTVIINNPADSNLGSAGTSVTIQNGTLEFNGVGISTSRPFSLTGGASIDVTTGNTATISGVVSGIGSLTKTDAGTLILSGANTYQGGTLISAGTLSIANDGNLGNTSGPLNIGSATLITTGAVTSARNGSFTGAAVINTMNNQDTFSGNFGGSGSLTVTGGNTVTLAGTNSYSSGTTVDTNTELAGTTNGIQGNITLNAGNSRLTFSQNFDGTYAGVITSAVMGAGPLTKQGAGTVTISSSSPAFSGPTSIQQGTLTVSGSIANSPVTVGAGATLKGSGTVGATTNSGIIDPGNGTSAVGSININGTLVLNPTSNVNIDLSATSADKIVVGGLATIAGSLSINPTPGFYGFSANYTILTSTGLALLPGFGPLTTTNPAFQPFVTYSATDAFLHIVISAPFAAFPFSNFNTAAVGHNIDALYAANQLSPDLFNVFNSFVGQSNAVINSALEMMHPAPYSAFTEMQTEVSGQLLSLFHRLPYLTCACSKPNRLWIEPFGDSLTMKHHGLEIGFQGNSGGIAFGYDGQVLESLVVGIGGAWNRNWLGWAGHYGSGESNGLFGSVYFDAQVGSFYLGGSFLGGKDFYHTSRHIDFLTTDRHAKAKYQAIDLMGQLATAYLFGSPQAFFYPYANFDYLYLSTSKFTESGAGGLNLNVRARTDATFRTEMGLGFQVQDRNAAETMCISPLFSLGWVNMCPLQRPLISATFEGASIPFVVRGWDESWNLFNASFGLTLSYRCFSVDLQYNVEISPDSETTLFNQHGNARIDWKW